MTGAARERRALLIVDDEEETLKALRRELRRDYDVVLARSAAEGYALLCERPIQVILSDQRMPGMTGTELYRKVRVDFPDAVRLLMTAYADTNAAIQAINEGGVHRFITKPWDSVELASLVRDAFSQHELAGERERRLGRLSAKVADVERVNEQLVELNRKRDEFVGVAAHDLRNPVAAIKWVASVLSAGADDPSKDIPRHIARIQANADFALQLLDDLLDITALEHGNVTLQLRDVDLRELIATSVSLSEHGALRKGISVVVDVPAGLPPVRCDAYRIEQVLNNLLSNAFKFSHPGTTVTVRARTIGEAIEVTVEDQGLGIRPEEIAGIFCRFRRTSTRSTGGEKSTGLGLSICKHLIDRHGGMIRVESQLGRGTRVVFTLPAPAERLRAPASPAG